MKPFAAWLIAAMLWAGIAPAAAQAPDPHAHHAMSGDPTGSVMNENTDRLPRNCASISEDVAITIHAGRTYAANQPGRVFAMSRNEVRVPPCSRVTVTFVNEDAVRHQWMVHGLPRYLYPAGMFHIEVSGGHERTGTFIVPADDRTYLIHCDIAQHMEKGMRAQLVVGEGSGDLWGVTGISDDFRRSPYLPDRLIFGLALLASGALALGWWLSRPTLNHRAEKRKTSGD